MTHSLYYAAQDRLTQRRVAMQPFKQDAIDLITQLPDDVDVDEIMYRLYVLDKVRKGREAVEQRRTISHEYVKREIEQW